MHTWEIDLDLLLFARYLNQEEEVSASKEGNVVKFLSPPIAAIMNSAWHMSKTPLSWSWKASLFRKKKWEAERNAREEVSASTELVFFWNSTRTSSHINLTCLDLNTVRKDLGENWNIFVIFGGSIYTELYNSIYCILLFHFATHLIVYKILVLKLHEMTLGFIGVFTHSSWLY